MELLKTNAISLIEFTSRGARRLILEGGEVAGAVKIQVDALNKAIQRADECTWVTGVVRFVDGIAVAISFVSILQALRSKHRLIPRAANDAFNKLGNFIGIPKHSADVMRHLKQLGILFVVVLVLRMIAGAITDTCVTRLLEQTMLLKKTVEANDALHRSVMRVVNAARGIEPDGDAEGQKEGAV
jgi:hypothetical protein